MAKSNVFIDEDALKSAIDEMISDNGVDIECPHCQKQITIRIGQNTCPYCEQSITLDYPGIE